MKKTGLLVSVLASILFGSLCTAADERPGLYGFHLAYPNEFSRIVISSDLRYLPCETMVPVLLEIDHKGKVHLVSPENAEDSIFVEYVKEPLMDISFEPAVFNGDRVVSVLPLIVQFRPKVKSPEVSFPISQNMKIDDADLFFKALELNDIILPRIERFPSYYSILLESDITRALPFVLIKLLLDESGNIVSAEKIVSTFSGFDDQLVSASLWAKFSSAVVKGTPVASPAFLLVSFFPYAVYPTPVWDRETNSELSLFNRLGVRLLADTVGLMSKPIPRRTPHDQHTLSHPYPLERDTVCVFLKVDTLGKARFVRCNRCSPKVRQAVHRTLRGLTFFPAVDYDGGIKPFRGLICLKFTGDSVVRISYDWIQ